MVISRRTWLEMATVSLPLKIHGEPSDRAAPLRLAMILESRSFLALSPNNRLIATYAAGLQERYLRPPEEEPVETIAPFRAAAIVLSRLGERDAVLSAPAEEFPFPCDFFADSARLLGQVPYIENRRVRHRLLLLERASGSPVRVLVPKYRERGYYFAIDSDMCICKVYTGSPWEGQIVLANIITGEQLVAVPFVPQEPIRRKLNPLFDLLVSADKSFILYQVSDLLVCREAKSLKCRWTWRVPSPMNIRAINISPKGDRIVIALLENTIASLATKQRIVIIAAEDRQMIGEFSLDGSDGVAIHPNRNILAIAKRMLISDQEQRYRLSVNVVDIDKQSLLQDLYHNETKGRKDTINSFFNRKGLSFSSDGRFLFVSAKHMKVWKFDEI